MALDPKQKEMQAHLSALSELQKRYTEAIKESNDVNEKAALMQEMFAERQQRINLLQANYDKLTETQQKRLANLIKTQEKEHLQLIEIKKEQKKINEAVAEEIKRRQRVVDLATGLYNALREVWKQLQSNDKIIRTTILNLGMSGVKADMMRTSFEQSAGFVTRLGGNLEDIQTIMEGYADETGRARVMSAEMVKDITAIGKGTGLGVEQATKLGAQFEIMGFDARNTMKYVQGVVDTSERMGVNTTKVLKNISDNFKKLQTYNFQQGVKGFAQMAQYAEKFKIDINDTLNAADTARTLEGAIGMVAQLQVMGGEFAKLDMFETLYFARNDPAKLQEKIAGLTKGLVSLRKTSDGTFEKFISPADRDRLNSAAKALGITNEKMTEMALRAFDIGKMSQQMAGMGLTDREKELIEGAAILNKETGRFQVQIGNQMKDISTLTKDQAQAFAKEQVSLQERAKQAMTFDETFKATIETLKSALLPLLRGINVILQPLSKVADGFSKLAGSGWGGVAAAAGILLAAGGLWKVVSFKLGESVKAWATMQGKKEGGGNIISRMINAKGGATPTGGAPAGGGANAGKGLMRGGAGIGAAALGIGAGIGAAAAGISTLADSLSKLTPEQAKTLSSIVKTLGWFVVGGALAAAAIMVLGTASTAASLGLLALGGAALMIGAGIGIAAAGIGFMGKGLAELVTAGKDAGPAMLQVGAGIGTISLAMMGFTAGALGFLTFAATMKTISNNADAMERVGNAFGNIKAVMSGSKDDFVAVENAVKAISNMNINGGGMLADLARLLKEPLKVEFANDSVTLNNDITLNIDGNRLMQKSYNVNLAIKKHEELKHGKGS